MVVDISKYKKEKQKLLNIKKMNSILERQGFENKLKCGYQLIIDSNFLGNSCVGRIYKRDEDFNWDVSIETFLSDNSKVGDYLTCHPQATLIFKYQKDISLFTAKIIYENIGNNDTEEIIKAIKKAIDNGKLYELTPLVKKVI